jgi:hypothetical protein
VGASYGWEAGGRYETEAEEAEQGGGGAHAKETAVGHRRRRPVGRCEAETEQAATGQRRRRSAGGGSQLQIGGRQRMRGRGGGGRSVAGASRGWEADGGCEAGV